jgi:hypothetical protein
VDAVIAWQDMSGYGGHAWQVTDPDYAKLAVETLSNAVASTVEPGSVVTFSQRVVGGKPGPCAD